MTSEGERWVGPSCVILGSGFSRAISEHMPTMSELGSGVLGRLGLEPTVLDDFGGNLEQWMSYLSVDQPWLTPADNYENRGLFERVSRAVYDEIAVDEQRVMSDTALPIWLARLAWTWNQERVRVFSFNYDTLLERAVTATAHPGTFADVYAATLGDRLSVGSGIMISPGPPTRNLLRLFKLHGSTSWAFSGLDGPVNDRILLWDQALGWGLWPAPEETPPLPRDENLWDDVVPLIIPPTLTKGPFYANLTLRAQWRRAAEALSIADRLTVIGYSFPQADLVAQQWVSTSFRGDRMDVVDWSDDRPASIRKTLAGARDGEDVTGENAIREYADRECGDHVQWSIWNDQAGLVRVELLVNGVDLFADVSPAEQTWTSFDEAQRWVHTRVEAAEGGNLIERSWVLIEPRGPGESRWAVLSRGKHLTL